MSIVIESKTHELKPEQILAARTLDRHVSVTAGPGAGKTTVLVERYLHILRSEDISVDQIVAITFTNRAANEMRERLRRKLDELLKSAAPAERVRWMRHKRTLDGAIITTIHGFCARLLREFPIEADIDPQFILLDAHRSSMLEESVAEESLTEFISSGDQPVTELTAGIGRGRLVRGLIDIYRSMRNQGLTPGRLAEETEKTHKTIQHYHQAIEDLSDRMREFLQVRELPPAARAKQREARQRWPSFHEFLTQAPESKSPAEFSEKVSQFREVRPKAARAIDDLVSTLEKLIWAKNLQGIVPQIFFDLHARRYAQELIKLIERIESRLDEEKRRTSSLDFDDLQVRALRLLEERPEVLRRTAGRYRFFLVDEFQDTNGLQRDLMARLALGLERRANLFIVGDRKQSIYGFRGADVDVFRQMTSRIEAQNGLSIPLNRNFRSQLPLIHFFNFLFDRIFEPVQPLTTGYLNELGYVEHEESIAARDDEDTPPVAELLIDLRPDDLKAKDDRWSMEPPRERDAEQLAARIISAVETESISAGADGTRQIRFRDIALLFRAMTEVHIYEAAFRRAGIPYVTVEGKGFYAREEITDFIQLLRFLDNKTDEVALAAVLRSPICGLSDDTLLALRCAPSRGVVREQTGLSKQGLRFLLYAVRHHDQIEFVDPAERKALDLTCGFLEELIRRAKRSRLSELLRFAVEASEYRTIAAAHFDGAQRLANIEKLFALAERFEKSGAYLIRDFVRFVREFEEAGGRESEGQIDDSADAVRLMSIHQSKGLEFPVVIIPDLHRQSDNRREWWAVDRHLGLTLKVPDGRGTRVPGSTFSTFTERAKRREEFESMRLIYVAATRAKDRLILSGAAKDLKSLRSSWLGLVCNALGLGAGSATGLITPAEGVVLRLTLNLLEAPQCAPSPEVSRAVQAELTPPSDERFPLLEPIESDYSTALYRFSVTQLLNYQRCARQYYFDRVLHAPAEEEIAIWNDAEAPEPPANLTATLRGAVIHRFCEKFRAGDDPDDCLKSSFDDVLRRRSAELAERILEIDPDNAVRELVPLARNYVASNVRRRVEAVRAIMPPASVTYRRLGVLSEQRFRLRRPLGILTGTIDKLLVFPASNGQGVSVEIIDFKTNRFRARGDTGSNFDKRSFNTESTTPHKTQKRAALDQLSFQFLQPALERDDGRDLLMRAEIEAAAIEYRVQMQAYALAAHELIPDVADVRVTLHFLDPDVEVCLANELLERDVCASAIDEIMAALVSSFLPESFPANPARHCRVCNFVEMCDAGRQFLRKV